MMKYVHMFVAITWTFLAITYGVGEAEPDKFLYTMMAGLLAAHGVVNFVGSD